jgi:hypothetical protein
MDVDSRPDAPWAGIAGVHDGADMETVVGSKARRDVVSVECARKPKPQMSVKEMDSPARPVIAMTIFEMVLMYIDGEFLT